MKKTLTAIMLLSSSAAAVAQEGSEITGMDISSSESPYTNVCMAATDSWSALDATIQEYGFTPLDTKEIYCNNKQLMKFARDNLRRNVTIPTKVVLKKSDTSTETEVCLAALTGEPLPQVSYTSMKTLRCNGKPVETFANRYDNLDVVDIL